MRGADKVVSALLSQGVRRVFSLSGNHIMAIYDAAIGTDLQLLHVRHEAAAVHMADASGRATGQPGIALLTGGPGHANGVPALMTASFSESPLVTLSGAAPISHMGKGAFQELRQAEMASFVAKASWTVQKPEDLGRDVIMAMKIASSGRPGPVSLSLPSDFLEADLKGGSPPPEKEAVAMIKERILSKQDAAKVVDLIKLAKRPLMLTSPFLNRSATKDSIVKLAEALDVPWASMESPRGMAEPSLGALSQVAPEADLIILFGKKIDFTLSFGGAPVLSPNSRFLQIDPEEEAVQRTEKLVDKSRILFTAIADLVPAAQSLITVAGTPTRRDWTSKAMAAINYRPPSFQSLVSKTPNTLHAAEVARALKPILARQPSALIADGGEYGQWIQGMLDADVRITNGPAGAIGAGPPFAGGVKAMLPNHTVIACMGDGSFGFHLAELDTAVRHKLNYVAVVGNDAHWNAERLIQVREYGADRQYACDLLPTRYDLAVAGLGGHGELVTRAEELPGALERALASGKPACVNVMLESNAAPSIKLP